MTEYVIAEKSTLTQIADSIRSVSNSTDPLKLDAFADTISSLSSGGGYIRTVWGG